MRWLYVLFCLLSVSFSACEGEAVIAHVGQFTITRQDVAWRDALHDLYFPQDKRKVGLDELVHAYTAAQILLKHGYALTAKAIEAEERRIDETTLMPDMLARIKAVFQGNQDGYRRVYVLPTLVERVVYYEFFLHDRKAQAESLRTAESFLAKAERDSANFRELAMAEGLAITSFTVAMSSGIRWHHAEQDPNEKAASPPAGMPPKVVEGLKQNQAGQSRDEAERWIKEVIAPLKPGAVFGKAVDFGEEWLVVRLVGPTPGAKESYELECVSVRKNAYERWWEMESKKVLIMRK
jgi:hypothetical protein